MKLFKQSGFLRKSQIYAIILFITVPLIAFFIFFFIGRVDVATKEKISIQDRFEELNSIINSYYQRDRQILKLATNIAEDIVHNSAVIEENKKKTLLYDVIDPYAKKTFKIRINEWLIDSVSIVNNFTLVDRIASLIKADISIYQKTDRAYVNISTSIQSLRKQRMLGDIILNNTKIVTNIEQDNGYIGRQLIDNFWYQVSYSPLYIDGQIKGLLYVRIKEHTARELKEIYKKWADNESKIQFLLNQNGKILAHPNIKQGTDFSGSQIFKTIKKRKRNKGNFEFVSKRDNEKWTLYYSYNEITKSYICILFKSGTPYRLANKILIIALLSILISVFLFYFLFNLANKPLEREFDTVKKIMTALISNDDDVSDEIIENHKFEDLKGLSRELVFRYKVLYNYAESLANDNYNKEYPRILAHNKLGRTLEKLNEKLKNTIYNESIRRKEEERKEWETERVSAFVNILQRNRDNLEELAYQLISNIVQYLDADVGALLFINSDDPNDIYFEQLATYAFEKQKFISNKIYPTQGYIGRIYNEKKTIFLTEVPEDYIKIASGLGKSSPESLLIVPLLINKEVYGAIEIASFGIIQKFQIDFIEKMAENIASTMNNVLVNNKTKELLKKSRKRAHVLSLEEEKMRKRLRELEEKEETLSSKIYANVDVSNSIESTVLVVEINREGTILFVNDLSCSFFNIIQEDIVNSHYNDYSSCVSVSEYHKLSDIWKSVTNGFNEQAVIEVKSGKDEMLDVLVSFVPIFDKGEIKSVICIGVVIKHSLDML